VRNFAYQFAKHTAKTIGVSSAFAVGYSHAPVEPNFVSNFVHTQTPFGRGYDYEIGSLNLRAKGDFISSALGRENMVSAVEKHASDSNIVDQNVLNRIINDPEYKFKIRANTTIGEKVFLGIPLVDLPTDSTDNGGSAIPNNQDRFSETSEESAGESTTFDSKKSVIKKHRSEPLPRRGNKPVNTPRRNTR